MSNVVNLNDYMPGNSKPNEYRVGTAPYELRCPTLDQRALQRARYLGAEAGLARENAEMNPYDMETQSERYKAWEYMYFKTLAFATKQDSYE